MKNMTTEKIIDPWGSNKIEDYKHIFKEFGLKKFTYNNIIDNYLFKREIIIAHRDFEKILDCIKNHKTFLQLTGIASSGPYHLGHKLDIDFYLVFKKLGAKSKFVVSDIDAYLSREDYKIPNLNKAKEYAIDNITDLLALGVDEKEIYLQSNQNSNYYTLSYEISKKITENMFKAIYGHIDFGKFGAVLLQIADILHIQLPTEFGKQPTLTGIGLEQDPHARLTRDITKKINYDFEIPSFFYFQHQSGLKEGKKMSSSQIDTAIFLNDTNQEIKRKINKAFTGGRITLEEQKEKGGQPEICKIYEIYKFHNPDSEFLKNTYKECKSGKLLCGECKHKCISFLNKMLEEHKIKKEKAKPIALRILKSD
jgi:tryptophanyl-tRNA synthetase